MAAFTAKEEVFQLVAKIISWKTRSVDSHSMQNQKKVSASEWQEYEKHLFGVYKTETKEEVQARLLTIQEAITLNEGFEQ